MTPWVHHPQLLQQPQQLHLQQLCHQQLVLHDRYTLSPFSLSIYPFCLADFSTSFWLLYLAVAYCQLSGWLSLAEDPLSLTFGAAPGFFTKFGDILSSLRSSAAVASSILNTAAGLVASGVASSPNSNSFSSESSSSPSSSLIADFLATSGQQKC
jgi:hypothetical protein